MEQNEKITLLGKAMQVGEHLAEVGDKAARLKAIPFLRSSQFNTVDVTTFFPPQERRLFKQRPPSSMV